MKETDQEPGFYPCKNHEYLKNCDNIRISLDCKDCYFVFRVGQLDTESEYTIDANKYEVKL